MTGATRKVYGAPTKLLPVGASGLLQRVRAGCPAGRLKDKPMLTESSEW